MPILIFIFVLSVVMLIYHAVNSAKEKKEAQASGMCSVCGKVQARKRLDNGEYACKECYEKVTAAELERKRKAEEAEKNRLAEAKPVEIVATPGTSNWKGEFIAGVSDTAGGWDVYLSVGNRSSKTVKYIYVDLIPYNAVGDVDYSPTVRAGTKNIRITGPIYGGCSSNEIVSKCWYEIKLSRVGIGNIKVVFMDGTEKTFRQ